MHEFLNFDGNISRNEISKTTQPSITNRLTNNR